MSNPETTPPKDLSPPGAVQAFGDWYRPDHTTRAQEIAEALRRDWGFDMRFARGINWLSRVIGENVDLVEHANR